MLNRPTRTHVAATAALVVLLAVATIVTGCAKSGAAASAGGPAGVDSCDELSDAVAPGARGSNGRTVVLVHPELGSASIGGALSAVARSAVAGRRTLSIQLVGGRSTAAQPTCIDGLTLVPFGANRDTRRDSADRLPGLLQQAVAREITRLGVPAGSDPVADLEVGSQVLGSPRRGDQLVIIGDAVPTEGCLRIGPVGETAVTIAAEQLDRLERGCRGALPRLAGVQVAWRGVGRTAGRPQQEAAARLLGDALEALADAAGARAQASSGLGAP